MLARDYRSGTNPARFGAPLAMWLFLPLVAVLPIQVGCGGGGGGVSSNNAVIQRNEPTISPDAVVLAASRAQGPWIPLDNARSIDGDLSRIRKQTPILDLIHARGSFVLTDMMVSVRDDSPWVAAWRAGARATGNTAIDSFFTLYNLTGVESMLSIDGHTWFLLKFAQSLNTSALVDPIGRLSPDILTVETDGWGGDGDEITLQETGGTRTYTFSHGWGDCPAGCIQRHSWSVVLAADGTMHVSEFGSALDPSDFPPKRSAAPPIPARDTRSILIRSGRARP